MAMNSSPYQAIRVMLDVRLPASAMVVVASACDGDGQDELACGIAQAFAETGRRTALISLYDEYNEWLHHTGLDLRGFTGSFLQAPHAQNELDSFITDARVEHDVVVVASPPLSEKTASLDLCRLANGVLLAVRLGRKITAHDEEAVTQLKRVDANIVGTVAMRRVAPSGAAAQSEHDESWNLGAQAARVNQFLRVLHARVATRRVAPSGAAPQSEYDSSWGLGAQTARGNQLLRVLRARRGAELFSWLVTAGLLAMLLRPIH